MSALRVKQCNPLHPQAASQTLLVNVTLGTRVSMEVHVHCAETARINLDWDLLVQAVLLLQYLQLAASQLLHVNVTLGTQEKMEAHARSAPPALTNLDWGLTVHTVPKIQPL